MQYFKIYNILLILKQSAMAAILFFFQNEANIFHMHMFAGQDLQCAVYTS